MNRMRASISGPNCVAILHDWPVCLGDMVYLHADKLVKNVNGKPLAKKQRVVVDAKVVELRFSRDLDDDDRINWSCQVLAKVPVYERDGMTEAPESPQAMLIDVEDQLRLWWDENAAVCAL